MNLPFWIVQVSWILASFSKPLNKYQLEYSPHSWKNFFLYVMVRILFVHKSRVHLSSGDYYILDILITLCIIIGIKYTGLLMGCGKKWEILPHFQGKLCGKKGLLCGKLCDFFKADLTLFFRSQRRKPIFLLSNGQLGIKKQ